MISMYNIVILNKGEMTMKKSKNNIKITEMEKVVQQAEFIAGLSHVFSIYSESQSDQHLSFAIESLCRRAIKHLDYCNYLWDRITRERDKETQKALDNFINKK